MSTYVLVAGAFHGAWCWYKTIPLLEEAGHKVMALDLPSLGSDKTPLTDVTLDLWTDHVCRALDGVGERCILVGHSRGGIVISQVAERRPDVIDLLVYIAAIMLRNGESLVDAMDFDPSGFGASAGRISISCDIAVAQETFYSECSSEDIALAKLLLQPEAMLPMQTPLQLTEDRYGTVPRSYIECSRDRAIVPAKQKAMYTANLCRTVLSMRSDHSPFFSKPKELVELLLQL